MTAKVSDADRDEVKADFWAIFDLPNHIAPGDAAVAEARRRAEVLPASGEPSIRARSPVSSTTSSR